MSLAPLNFLDAAKEIVGKKLDKRKKEGALTQFEPCDCTTCKYYNEAGTCSYETCRVRVDDPLTASMVVKTCQFCGNEFSTCMSGMAIQLCPACLQAALLAEGHPHNCVFCGRQLDSNPSFFFPCCDQCLDKLRIVCHGSETSLELASNAAHC